LHLKHLRGRLLSYLKIIFGEYSQRSKGIEWHTSITVPWAQAKVLNYYLQINIEAHELQQGKIKLSASMIPAAIPPPDDPSDEAAQAFFQMLQRNREKLLESLE